GHAAALREKPLHDGKEKRCGLPAAGHRAGEDVAAGERRRDGVSLDGCRTGEAELACGAEEGRVEAEAEAGEGHEIATSPCPASRGSADGAASVPAAQGRPPAAERACACRDRSWRARRAGASRRSPSRCRGAAPPPLATRR